MKRAHLPVLLAATLFGLVACSSSGPAAPLSAGSSGGASASGGTGGSSGSSGQAGDGGADAAPAVTTPAGWGAQACPAPSAASGFAVGEALGDLGVRDCDTGAPANLDEVCGASATWVFAAHTHCPTCQATAGFTDEVAAAVADKNVAVVMTVYDDNGTSCAKWRDAYKLAGLPNVRVYADPGGKVWSKLKTSNFTAPSAFTDKNRVITYKEHGLGKAQVLTQIDAALAAP